MYLAKDTELGRQVALKILPPDVADIGLGIVLYEMATGRRPFSGTTATETINQIINAEPPSICELNAKIPASLEQRITRCLEKKFSKTPTP